MTKKDYQLIADLFNGHINGGNGEPSTEALKCLAWSLAIKLEQDNPRFNRDRFLQACGL